jgi:hypothetical protein
VAQVLDDCGSDIDAAIRRLGELKLNTLGSSVAEQRTVDLLQSSGLASPSHVPHPAGNPGPNASQQPFREAADGAKEPVAAGAQQAEQAACDPQTSADWIEALVQQMAGARDLDDARARAAQVLQAFARAAAAQVRPLAPCAARALFSSTLSASVAARAHLFGSYAHWASAPTLSV